MEAIGISIQIIIGLIALVVLLLIIAWVGAFSFGMIRLFWPALFGIPLGVIVSNKQHTLLGVVIILGSILGSFAWYAWHENKKDRQ